MKYYASANVMRNDARIVYEGSVMAQRQDSLSDQLWDLRMLANRFGMYDAADFLGDFERRSELERAERQRVREVTSRRLPDAS